MLKYMNDNLNCYKYEIDMKYNDIETKDINIDFYIDPTKPYVDDFYRYDDDYYVAYFEPNLLLITSDQQSQLNRHLLKQ